MRRTPLVKFMKRIGRPLAFLLALNFSFFSDSFVGYTQMVAQAQATPPRTFATIPPAVPPSSPPKSPFLPNVPQLLNNIPPSITASAPVTVDATSPAGASVTLTAQVQDPDCNVLTVTWNADGGPDERVETLPHSPGSSPVSFTHTYAVGVHPVKITVSDGTADPVIANTTVTVRDTQAPAVSCALDTATLWPPNHKWVDVGLTITGSADATYQVAVYGDEDDGGAGAPTGGKKDPFQSGDCHFAPDAFAVQPTGTGRIPLFLRSERYGSSDGRVYLIVVTARDSSGNTSFACCTAVVPHSMGQADRDAVEAQAAAARATCTATGSPQTPFLIGDGPVVSDGKTCEVEAIYVTPANASMLAGATRQYSAIGFLEDGRTKDLTNQVTWTRGNAAILSVGTHGLVTGVAAGTTTVKASKQGVSGSTNVTVDPSGLVSIIVSPETMVYFPGTSRALTAIGTYADGTTQDLTQQVTWTTTSAAVATVDLSGLATAAAEGTATLKATKSGVTGSATMTVLARHIESIVVNPDHSDILVGQFAQLRALATYSDCTSKDVTDTATWTTDSAAIATVNAGLVEGIGGGQAIITATQDGLSGSATVTVSGRRLISISVVPQGASIPVGSHVGCRATGHYSDATTEDITSTCAWASANTVSLPITAGGVATGASPGASTVSATKDGITGTTLITVTPPALLGIVVTPPRASALPTEKRTYIATGRYSDGSSHDLSATATWTSSNPAIATVAPGGLATAVVPGAAGITASQAGFSGTASLDVFPATLIGITVTPAEATIAAGATQTYTATGAFSDGTTANITNSVTWTTAAGAIATITAGGVATGKSGGTTTVTASKDGLQGNAIIRVLPPQLVSLAVTPAAATIPVGVTLPYHATGTYSDGSTQDLTTQVGWTSVLPAVASIGVGGIATGVTPGTTTITAAKDGLTANASLTVIAPVVSSLSIAPLNAAIPVGGAIGYQATALYSDGTSQDVTATATWTSSNAGFATISPGGLATGVAAGTTTITASQGGKAASTALTVTSPGLLSITVSPPDATIEVGAQAPYIATGHFAGGATQDLTLAVTWSTGAAAIATIDATGKATGIAPGATTILASQGGISGQATLTVLPASLVAIAVTPAAAAVQVGQTRQYTATGTYSNGSTKDLTAAVTWSTGSPSTASVNATGLAKGLAVGVTPVTATKDGLSGSASLRVTAGSLLNLTVTPPEATIYAGNTQQYHATGTYSDGSTQDLTNVVAWTTSDATLAAIAATGLVKGAKEGTAVVRAETGGVQATAVLTVLCSDLLSLSISPSNVTLVPGSKFKLTTQGTYANGAVYAGASDLMHYWPGDGDARDVVGGLDGVFVNGATADGVGVHNQAFKFNGSTQSVSIADHPSLNFKVTDAFSIEAWALVTIPNSVGHILGKRADNANDEYQLAFDPSHGMGFTCNADNGANSHVVPAVGVWGHYVGTYDNQRWRIYINGELRGKETNDQPIPLGNINAAPFQIGRSDGFEVWPGLVDEVKMYRHALTPDEVKASVQATSQCIAPLILTWTSSDTSVATVDATGTVTAVAPGTATITATDQTGQSASLQVVVDAVSPYASIAVTPVVTSVPTGDSIAFTATGTHSDGTTEDITASVAWSSNNLFAATVTAAGVALGVKEGSATISASKDGLRGDAVLTVGPPRLLSFVLQPPQISVSAGNSGDFHAIGTYVGGGTRDITRDFGNGLLLWCPADGNANDIAGNVAGALINGATAGAQGQRGQAFQFNGSNQYVSIPTNFFEPRFAFLQSDFTLETWVNFNVIRPGAFQQVPNVLIAQDQGGGNVNKWIFYHSDQGLCVLVNVVAPFGGQAFFGPAPFSPSTNTWYHVAVARKAGVFTFSVNGSPIGTAPSSLLIPNVNGPLTIGQAEGLGFINGRMDDVGIWNRALSSTDLQKVMRAGKWFLEWSSSNPAQAVVSQTGTSTGVTPGGATITASTLDGLSATGQVTVTAAVPVRIDLTPAGNSLAKGRTLQYTATQVYSDATTLDVTAQALWTVSDPSVALAGAGGAVTGLAPGQVLVSAMNGSLTGSAGLTVTPPVTESIVVAPATATLAAGHTLAYTATETLSDGTVLDATATSTWSVVNPAVASISGAGLATGVGAGATQIRATKNGVTGSATLTVTQATPVALAVLPSTATLAAGQSLQYTAIESYSDGSSLDVTATAAWSVNSPAASVNSSGLVAALAAGGATVSASRDGLSGSATLTVVSAQLVSIAVTPLNTAAVSGQNVPYTATGSYSDGSSVNLTASVLWKSSDVSVASIDAAGLAHALTAGQTTISASLSGVTGATSLTVTGLTLVSLSIAPGSVSVPKGNTQQFIATGTYSDGSTLDVTAAVTWSSGNPTAATVNAAGLATAKALGIAPITATKGGGSVSASMTVVAPVLKQIAITPANASTYAGSKVPYNAKGTYSDGSVADVTSTVIWSSSDATVATLSPGGQASALKAGLTTVSAQQSGVTGSTLLTVTAAQLVSIVVNPALATNVPSGNVTQYTATGKYSDGTTAAITTGLVWSSTDSSVAAVNATGAVTAKAGGHANIQATVGNISGSASISVAGPTLYSIAVTPASATVLAGDSRPYTAIGTYSTNTTQDITALVSWSTGNAAIGTVDAGGLATGVATGSTLVIASKDGAVGSGVLVVSPPVLRSIVVTPTTASTAAGLKVAFSAKGIFSDGSKQTLPTPATWTSSDPTVATIAANGLATGLKAGPVTITAGSGGFTGTATLTVTAPLLVSLAVTPGSASATGGQVVPFTAKAGYSDGTQQDVTATAAWSSSDPSVATVTAGAATALTGGQATITATVSGISVGALLTVTGATLVNISVAPINDIVSVGFTRQFTATGNYSDGTHQDLTALVQWTTSKPAVGTISALGLATAVTPGFTIITAAKDGASTSTAFNVSPPVLQSLTVTPPQATRQIGQQQGFTALGVYSDGVVRDATLQVTWTTSDAAVASVSPAGVATALAGGLASISASKDGVSASATFQVIRVVAIAVSPSSASVIVGLTRSFTATGTYSDGTTQDITAVATWTSSAPSVASVTGAGQAKGVTPGLASISASKDGTSGSASLTVTPPPPPPTASITSPAADSTVTLAVDVRGTASAAYVLEAGEVGGGLFRKLATGSAPVTDAVVGRFDPTLLINGIYTIRLTVTDELGQTAIAEVQVIVDGYAKIGVLSVGFDDLTIPVSGVPVTVVRFYDSRLKQSSDFGIGWSLSLNTMNVHTNTEPGNQGWMAVPNNDFFHTNRLVITGKHYATIAFGDGRTETFDFTPFVENQFGSSIWTAPTTEGRLTTISRLEPLGDSEVLLSDGYLFDLSAHVYNPQDYRLITKDGTAYLINLRQGLQEIRDTNGNVVTISPAGVIHSSGVSVPFVRDAAGRITSISDPDGHSLNYTYDTAGHLTAVKDRAGNTTTYAYGDQDNLVDIVDAVGRRAVRNEYDPAGRLIATIDADGHRLEYTHLPDTRQEILRDANGNQTVSEYDDRGHVVSVTDALGHRNTSNWDDADNELTQTDALGHTTTMTYDNQGNMLSRTVVVNGTLQTTTNTYNALGLPLTTTDPLGRVLVNTFDPAGNVLTMKDGLGNVLTRSYSQGNLSSSVDAQGTRTECDYDGRGNIIEQRLKSAAGALLRKTTSTYDNSNRPTTTTVWKGDGSGNFAPYATTSTVYDANGKVVETRDPLGHSKIMAYAATGQLVSITDKNGNVTQCSYDSRGKLTETRFPSINGVIPTEVIGYDAQGNRTTSKDRNGNTTTYVYDSLNRPFKVIYPDGSFQLKVYDAAYRIQSVTDQRNFTTTYGYDELGRKVTVTDSLGDVTHFEYDAANQQLAMVDALGHRTQFQYDAAGHLTQTTFHDGTSRRTEYSQVGLATAEVDEAGARTELVYGPTRELLEVRRPDPANMAVLSTITRYEYDSLGRKIRQIDALGRSTRFDYTVRGELLSRTRPLGEQEVFTYDPQGNLQTRTDAMGRTTSFAYNGLNLPSSKSFPDGLSQEITYFPGGQRASFTRGSEVTQFTLDNRNRFSSQTNPDGSALSWTYDALGNRTGVTVSHLGTVSQQIGYTWSSRNELSQVFRNGQLWASYSYDDVGNRQSLALANGTSQTLSYNTKNQLLAVQNLNGSGVMSSYAYTLDARGLRLGVVESTGRTVTYGYDSLKRLVQEQILDSGQTSTIGYSLDLVGNRLQKQVATTTTQSTTYTYNADDRLLSEVGPAGLISYTYNANGETTQQSGGGAGTMTYSWDFEGRMIGAQTPTKSLAFAYDLDGVRSAKSVNGTPTRFVVDRNRAYAQVLEECDSTGAIQAAYVYGDGLISQESSVGLRFYHADGQCSTRQLSDASGAATDQYTYDAFGVLSSSAGTTSNRYLYAGEQFDSDLGTYYQRSRYFNQNIGRFTSQDPAQGSEMDPPSLHRYLYASVDPVDRRDPSGLQDLISTLNSIAIMSTVSTIGTPVLSGTAQALLPKWVLSGPPNAFRVGISVEAGFQYGLSGGVSAGLDALYFFASHTLATYSFVGTYVGAGTGTGLGASLTTDCGFVYNTPNSDQYHGSCWSLSFPLSKSSPITSKFLATFASYAAVATAAAAGMASALVGLRNDQVDPEDVSGTEAGKLVGQGLGAAGSMGILALVNGLVGNLDLSGGVGGTLSWSYADTKSNDLAVGLGFSAGATPTVSGGWSYYYKLGEFFK